MALGIAVVCLLGISFITLLALLRLWAAFWAGDQLGRIGPGLLGDASITSEEHAFT